MEWITQPEAWIALATLTALEIVLGIDNIIFLFNYCRTAAGTAARQRKNYRAWACHADPNRTPAFDNLGYGAYWRLVHPT